MLLLGSLMVFSFAPHSIHWSLAFVLICALYQAIQHLTPRQGFIAGWFFGLGYFGFSVSWVYNSIHLFGDAAAPLAGAVTLLFVLVMTLFPALACWAYLRIKPGSAWPLRALLFASIWVLLELARGKIMGGFPWALLGYSQTTELTGALAPWIGVFGISFLVVWLPNLVVDVVRCNWIAVHQQEQLLPDAQGIQTKNNGSRRFLAIVSAVAIVGFSFVFMKVAEKTDLSSPTGSSLNVRLVQANIPQELKFSVERLEASLDQYTRLSVTDLPPTDLIIWPETAIPTFFSRVEAVIEPFANQLHAAGTEVLAGGFYSDGKKAYNSIRQLGGEKALYQKRHLVPFGEYMPFRFMLNWLAAFIEIPMSDLGAGTGAYVPMSLHNEAIGLSICYEDVFGEEMRALLPAATLLVNVSNDAWFGDGVAPYQHQQKAQMRAREMARPLIRVTNTGVSSVMDHRGQLQGSIAHNTQGTLDTTVYPRQGYTLYARTGNWPVFLLSVAIVLLAGLTGWRKQR